MLLLLLSVCTRVRLEMSGGLRQGASIKGPQTVGDGPNTVSESTVSNTELSEFGCLLCPTFLSVKNLGGCFSGRVRPRQGTEICNFGAPSPLEALHWIFCFFSSFYVQSSKASPLNLEKVAKNPVEKIASNPVTSVAVMVFSALSFGYFIFFLLGEGEGGVLGAGRGSGGSVVHSKSQEGGGGVQYRRGRGAGRVFAANRGISGGGG